VVGIGKSFRAVAISLLIFRWVLNALDSDAVNLNFIGSWFPAAAMGFSDRDGWYHGLFCSAQTIASCSFPFPESYWQSWMPAEDGLTR
jgi:hypothetical protein